MLLSCNPVNITDDVLIDIKKMVSTTWPVISDYARVVAPQFAELYDQKMPTIADLMAKLRIEGREALVWKADLARAYRQLRADPLDAPLLGIMHNNSIYLDRCPPFGCRSSSTACQRVANALVYMLASNSHHCLAYLDDFSGCDRNFLKATAGFHAFIDLAKHLGLQLSISKCVAPTTSIEWLGY